MKFSCRIADEKMLCTITSDRDLPSPVFCCSGMTVMTAIDGGEKIEGLGSFTAVQLPDLKAGVPHHLTLIYPGYAPANRAWMPLGPYLRAGKQTYALPPVLSGKKPDAPISLPVFEGLQLVPQPNSWAPSGEHLKAMSFACDDPAFAAVDGVAERKGLGAFLSTDGVKITLNTTDMPVDAYNLDIHENGITVSAGGYGGRFYAAITLLTLMKNHDGQLPCGQLRDQPRFGWRGQHLDCARHFYKPETILDLLDLMALMKLNRFHWHFADDEAFRLEVDSYPELWQKTRLCGEGHLMPALFSGAVEAGGSYSKSDAATIVARAKNLNIEVMPEIEALSHALAFGRVFPDMLDPEDTGTEASVQGYQKNVLNPAMPKTWEVLPTLAKEVADLFPFSHLHLGCDELPDGTWMKSPAARALMSREGLTETKDLLGWTASKLAATLAEHGVRAAAWEEAAQGSNGGIGNNAILFSWTGKDPGFAAARAGYSVVMTPAQHIYLDMAHTDDVDDWGANWAAYVSLADTIKWDPVPKNEPGLENNIIGVQGAFWSEFTTQDDQMWPMILPRILGVSVKAWQQEDMTEDTLLSLAAAYQGIAGSFDNTTA